MIIGICGFQASGKDTVADFLIKEHRFKRLSFASALKDIVAIIFSWPRDKLEGLTKEDREWREQIDTWWSKSLKMHNLTPRFVLQHFGTEIFRNHWHPDIWVKVLENKILEFLENDPYTNIIITDCRFENEINMLLRYGAKIFHIHRNMPSWFYKYKMGIDVDEIKTMHKSEIIWIRCFKDYEIENNGSKEELYKKISKYII